VSVLYPKSRNKPCKLRYNRWKTWIFNCSQSDISLGDYPLTIPANIGVPAYAYLNVTNIDNFDVQQAMALAISPTDPPDSTAVAPTGTSTSHSNGHATNTGAIAGGVVGGVVGLALIIFGALYFIRRKRYQPVGTDAEKAKDSPKQLEVKYSSHRPGHHHKMSTLSSDPSEVFSTSSVPLRLYDPSDPSTFPRTPVSNISGARSTSAMEVHSPDASSQFSHSRGPSDGTYRGVPEI